MEKLKENRDPEKGVSRGSEFQVNISRVPMAHLGLSRVVDHLCREAGPFERETYWSCKWVETVRPDL